MNSLGSLDETWPLKVRITSDGVRALWRELNRFSGGDASQRVFRQSHGDFHFEKSFRNAITLADEYYAAYDDANQTIDAVLLYYGSMWLGQAVNYATHPKHVMDERADQHGIKPQINPGDKWPLLKAKLHVSDGKATFNLTNLAFGGDDLNGRTFDLLDFLRAIPELDEYIEQVTGSGTTALRFAEAADSDFQKRSEASGRITIQVEERAANIGYFKTNVAIYDYLAERNVTFGQAQVSWVRKRKALDELNALSISSGTARYLLPKLQGLKIAEASLYIGVIHALSELVRYYADTWLQIADSVGDEAFIIRQFMHLAEEKVPLLVLNHLSKAEFLFRSR